MTVLRMEHAGVVVDDLRAAIGFFGALGLEVQGEGSVEGDWVDRVVGLEGVQADIAMMRVPNGHGAIELVRFHAPPVDGSDPDTTAGPPPNARGIRHLAFAVEDVDATVVSLAAHGVELVGEVVRYRDAYRLGYVRGPAGVIVELVEALA